MKARALTVSLLAFGVLIPALSSAQKPESSQSVLKFEMSQETKLQGVIEEVKDRLCPMSGGMGLRLTVKIEDKIYEVHVAPVKFVKLRKRATRRAIPSRSSVLAQNFKAGMPSCPARSRTAATIWYSATKTAPIWQ